MQMLRGKVVCFCGSRVKRVNLKTIKNETTKQLCEVVLYTFRIHSKREKGKNCSFENTFKRLQSWKQNFIVKRNSIYKKKEYVSLKCFESALDLRK